jgi:hypothetical protein
MAESTHGNDEDATNKPNGGDASSVPLAPDDATSQIDTGTPSDLVALTGFLGEGKLDDELRVYENVSFRRWVVVQRQDIVARFSATGDVEVDDDNLTPGPSEITVRRDAIVVVCESVPASSFETPPTSPTSPVEYRWPRRGPR